jgi:hypothetical protein
LDAIDDDEEEEPLYDTKNSVQEGFISLMELQESARELNDASSQNRAAAAGRAAGQDRQDEDDAAFNMYIDKMLGDDYNEARLEEEVNQGRLQIHERASNRPVRSSSKENPEAAQGSPNILQATASTVSDDGHNEEARDSCGPSTSVMTAVEVSSDNSESRRKRRRTNMDGSM